MNFQRLTDILFPPRPTKRGTKIEVELGPNDILVLHSERGVSFATAKRLKEEMESVLKKEGKAVLVLGDGLTYSIIKRPKGDK